MAMKMGVRINVISIRIRGLENTGENIAISLDNQ